MLATLRLVGHCRMGSEPAGLLMIGGQGSGVSRPGLRLGDFYCKNVGDDGLTPPWWSFLKKKEIR
jgi:hypothetical protein